MLHIVKKNTTKNYSVDIFCRRLCDDNKKKKRKKKRIKKKVQVQLESFKSGIEALNNIQQNVYNRHLMMTLGGVETVVLKCSYIIRHTSDIITEYVNKKQL